MRAASFVLIALLSVAVSTAEAAKNQRPGLVAAVASPLVLAAKMTSATSTTSSIDQLESIRNQPGIRTARALPP